MSILLSVVFIGFQGQERQFCYIYIYMKLFEYTEVKGKIRQAHLHLTSTPYGCRNSMLLFLAITELFSYGLMVMTFFIDTNT